MNSTLLKDKIKDLTTPSGMGYLFCVAILGVFALILKDYGDITSFKNYAALIIIPFFAFTIIITFLINNWYKFNSSVFKTSTIFFALIFLVCCVMSVLFSQYLTKPDGINILINGKGRGDGLYYYFLYLACFFIPALFCGVKRSLAYVLGGVSIINSILLIFQLYGKNPLNLIPDGAYNGKFIEFGGTLGNIDLLSAYFCLAVSFMAVYYVVCKDNKIRFSLLIAIAFSTYSIRSINVYSGYIGLAFAIIIALPILASNHKYLCRLIDVAISVLVGIIPTTIINHIYPKNLGQTITTYSISKTTLFIALAIILALEIRLIITKFKPKYNRKIAAIVLAIIELCAIVTAVLIIKFCFKESGGLLGEISAALNGTLNDMSGSHRIAIWRFSFELFKDNPIFGTGVGAFTNAFSDNFLAEYQAAIGKTAHPDSVHNEYLQMLVTTGICGFISYMGMLISLFVRAIKCVFKNPLISVALIASLAYSAQMFFNINIIIVAPFFFCVLGMLEYEIRKAERENNYASYSIVSPSEDDALNLQDVNSNADIIV